MKNHLSEQTKKIAIELVIFFFMLFIASFVYWIASQKLYQISFSQFQSLASMSYGHGYFYFLTSNEHAVHFSSLGISILSFFTFAFLKIKKYRISSLACCGTIFALLYGAWSTHINTSSQFRLNHFSWMVLTAEENRGNTTEDGESWRQAMRNNNIYSWLEQQQQVYGTNAHLANEHDLLFSEIMIEFGANDPLYSKILENGIVPSNFRDSKNRFIEYQIRRQDLSIEQRNIWLSLKQI